MGHARCCDAQMIPREDETQSFCLEEKDYGESAADCLIERKQKSRRSGTGEEKQWQRGPRD